MVDVLVSVSLTARAIAVVLDQPVRVDLKVKAVQTRHRRV